MSTHAERLEAAKAGRPAAEFRPPDLETDPAPSLTEHAHEVMRHLDAATVWHVELLATTFDRFARGQRARFRPHSWYPSTAAGLAFCSLG